MYKIEIQVITEMWTSHDFPLSFDTNPDVFVNHCPESF